MFPQLNLIIGNINCLRFALLEYVDLVSNWFVLCGINSGGDGHWFRSRPHQSH